MEEKSLVDVLIHVALPEEAKAFWDAEFPKLTPEAPLETFPYHTFSYFDSRTNEARSGIVLTVGEVGDRTREAIVLFCTRFRPRFVLNVGISGRVGNDASVGDVVIPDQITIYDYRGAVRDAGNDDYELVLGGQATTVDRLCLNIASSVEFSKQHPLPTFEAHCARNTVQLTANERGSCSFWQHERKLATKPRLVAGPFAVGSLVNKSAAFSRDLLLKTNRNIIAVDMESGLVGDALKSLGKPPRFYSVRAISDPGTGEKSQFDSIGQGAIRQWAMSNAIQVIKALLDTKALFNSGASEDLAASITAESFGIHYLSQYPGQRYTADADLDGCDLRFANLNRVGRDGTAFRVRFRDFLGYLREHPQGTNVLVEGHGGAGKSALLKLASVQLSSELPESSTVFLNMRVLRGIVDGLSNPRQALQSEIERLAPSVMSGTKPVTVFLDELYGFLEEQAIFDELRGILERTKPTVVMAFGKDHYEALRFSSQVVHKSYIENIEIDAEFVLRNVSISNPEMLRDIIEGTLRTTDLRNEDASAEAIAAKLKELRFSYVNHFVISLYLANCRKTAFKNIKNSTGFILMAMRFLCDSLAVASEALDLEDVSVEALRAFSKTLSRQSISPERRSYNTIYRDVFAHFPKSVQTALVANAVVHFLSEASSEQNEVFARYKVSKDSFYGLVFGNDVNSCVKDLLEDEQVEERVLKRAEILLNEVNAFSLSYALYLFGRARSVAGRQRAAKAFETARAALAQEPKHSPGSRQLSEEERYLRLAERSLSISLSMNDDSAATEEYIQRLLDDPTEDKLNRSFHLEYYGDQSSLGINVELSMEDSGGSWKRTREVLSGKIQDLLLGRVFCEYDRILIATYFSLVRYRHEHGKLSTEEIKAHKLLGCAILDAQFDLGTSLNGFLAFMVDALDRSGFDKIDAILDLYRLKEIPRAGWVRRGMADDTPQIETVASHTWGAILLADTLSDWLRPPVSNVDKHLIIRTLISHDIAEVIIGDYTPEDGDTKLRERDAMARIAAFANLDGLGATSRWRSDWENFESRRGCAASLAKDFDKLDAVFEGLRLSLRFPSTSDRRKFFDYNINQIVHSQLRTLAREVRKRADGIARTDAPNS